MSCAVQTRPLLKGSCLAFRDDSLIASLPNVVSYLAGKTLLSKAWVQYGSAIAMRQLRRAGA